MKPPWWFCRGWWSPWCVLDRVTRCKVRRIRDAQSPQVLDRAGVQLLMESYLAGRRSADEYYAAVETLAAQVVEQELADARDRRLRQRAH